MAPPVFLVPRLEGCLLFHSHYQHFPGKRRCQGNLEIPAAQLKNLVPAVAPKRPLERFWPHLATHFGPIFPSRMSNGPLDASCGETSFSGGPPFEGVFHTLGNKDASGEFPRLPPQETAGVGGGNGAGGAGEFCDFGFPKMRDP